MAVYDKDVTYQYVMNEEEEEQYYRTHDFSVRTPDDSFIATSSVRHMPLIKANFQYLYHTTQQNWDFNWKVFFLEVLYSVSLAVILCTLAFSVCSGVSIQHEDGYTYDFWMASFTIYGCLIYITNVAIALRSGQITWFVMFWIAFFSVIPFLVISLLFDTIMKIENGSQYILLNMGSTYHYYLVCCAMVFIAFLFEITRKFVQVIWRPRLSDYFRLLINRGLENDPSKFEKGFLASFSHLRNPIQKHKIKMANRSNVSASAIVTLQDQPASVEVPKRDEEMINKSHLDSLQPIRKLSAMSQQVSLEQNPSSQLNPLRKKISSPSIPSHANRQSIQNPPVIFASRLSQEEDDHPKELKSSRPRKMSVGSEFSNKRESLLPPISPGLKKKSSRSEVS